MKDIKQQFKEFRASTPKHIQWLFLVAAFLVVVILLTLLLGDKSEKEATIENTPVDFKITPKQIDLTDIEVGSSENESINISVNTPVIVKSINVPVKAITTTDTCEDLSDKCIINVIYKPTTVQQKSDTTLTITWYVETQPEILNTEEISITYSSWKEEEPISVPEPPVETIPEPPVSVPEPPVEDPDDKFNGLVKQNPFKEEDKPLTAEKCSDFAIPGYDQSGRQIGWIKPERGANYFHPFSDKDCSKPTGKYDFNTGIITSLEDGSKIGTDSDHIGYRNIRNRNISAPKLSMPQTSKTNAWDYDTADFSIGGKGTSKRLSDDWGLSIDEKALRGSSSDTESIISSRPYDRTFILRQFKPIPATIVSEVRADPSVYGCSKAGGSECDPNKNYSIPVRATVDRNVYSDDGRTVILPTGTLLMGYLSGDLPGPYQAFGRMNIKWYQFIRPDGVEFNFKGPDQDPYSADAQGRMGVPGHGSTDYMEQMVMPILTAMVPAAVNMIAPIADTVINQIDLDNNTIVQSGTIRSSEMAKQDVINTWNKITQKLLVDAIDNTVPPFSIAAGTRINVFSPVDLIVTCGRDGLKDGDKITSKCAFIAYNDTDKRRDWSDIKKYTKKTADDSSWVGQVRSFDLMQYCKMDGKGKLTIDNNSGWEESGQDYRTVLLYCESQNYQAKNNAKQSAYNENVVQQSEKKYGSVSYDKDSGSFTHSFVDDDQKQLYNTEVLGLKYDDEGNIENPFETKPVVIEDTLTCDDGNAPDENGCCAGETYTDMGDAGFNCCPDTGGDCFPPIIVE
jgi:type IV secretory pathway VirB10-like protein